MRVTQAAFVIGLCTLGAGCDICKYSKRNLLEAPVDVRDNVLINCRDHQLAEAAWEEVQHTEPAHAYSVHYARGFKDGFADYVYAGGAATAPVMPPRRYRKAVYETPEGHQAIEDWFAGFHRGALAAQASGYRDLIVLPLEVGGPAAAPGAADPGAHTVVQGPAPLPVQETPPEAVLQPPRKLSPPGPAKPGIP
jgi:hypothetical protein